MIFLLHFSFIVLPKLFVNIACLRLPSSSVGLENSHWHSVHHRTLTTYHCCQLFSGRIQFSLSQLQNWLIFCHRCFSPPVCLHGHFTNTWPVVTLTSAHTLANVIIDVYWDHWECFNLVYPAWSRWPCQSWSNPGLCPSSTHTPPLPPPDPHPSGGSFCCVWGSPDGSALVWPPVTAQQTEISTELLQATLSTSCSVSELIRNPLNWV